MQQPQINWRRPSSSQVDCPVLRPLWKDVRNARGETDEMFDGYGLLTGSRLDRLPDGALAFS